MYIDCYYNALAKGENSLLNFSELEKILDLQFFSILVENLEESPNEISRKVKEYGVELVEKLVENPNTGVLLSKSQLDIIENNKFLGLVGVEGLDCIGNNPKTLCDLYALGFRLINLSAGNDNSCCAGYMTKNDYGLTQLGREVISRAISKGMIIDLANVSDKTFWDTYKMTNVPLIVSNGCCKKIGRNIGKNLDDEKIKALGNSGGVIGINFSRFLLAGADEKINEISIYDVVNHIRHCANIGGIEAVSIGSNILANENLPLGINKVEDYYKIAQLLNRCFKADDVEKIMGGNILRVLKDILK